MRNKIKLLVLFLFIATCTHAQKQELVVKEFEYIRTSNFSMQSNSSPTTNIITSSDSFKLQLSRRVFQEINDRWGIAIPNHSLDVKTLSALSMEPKFKCEIKEKQNGKWFLFFQIFDKGKNAYYYNNNGNFCTSWVIKCRILNGSKDSIVYDKAILVNIFTNKMPPGQVMLDKVLIYPPSYKQGIDSIVSWLFRKETNYNRELFLPTACLFQPNPFKWNTISTMVFQQNNDVLSVLSEPAISLRQLGDEVRKTHKNRNIGGNLLGGTITLLTGADVAKSKSVSYVRDYPFFDGKDTLHCQISFMEVETTSRQREVTKTGDSKSYSINSSDYSTVEIRIDTSFTHFISKNGDTVAHFKFEFIQEIDSSIQHPRIWDGLDSSTIMEMPDKWLNPDNGSNVEVNGVINNRPFVMQSSRQLRLMVFSMNEQPILLTTGYNPLEKGYLFQSASTELLKLFTIIASIPYKSYH